MEIRHIRRQEQLELEKLMSLCFEFPFDDTENTDPLVWAAHKEEESDDPQFGDRWWAAFEDTQLLGAVNALPKTVFFDGSEQAMAAVGGVATRPEYRRGGIIRQCFEDMLPALYKEGYAFSYLFPFSERFYRRFGFESACQTIVWSLEIDKLPDYEYAGSFSLVDTEELPTEVRDIYTAAAPMYNMMVCRRPGDYRHANGAKPYRRNRYLYVYRNGNGEPCGYFVFNKLHEGGRAIMDCSELCFTNADALFAIVAFVRRFGSDYRVFRFLAPACMNLDSLCTEFVHTDTARSVVQNGMVRVVNAETVLKAAAYRGSGQLTLYLLDHQIPENNGAFEVTFADGHATAVARVSLSSQETDMAMPIGVFSAAIVGRLDEQALHFRPDVRLNNSALATQLFFSKPNWIQDWF